MLKTGHQDVRFADTSGFWPSSFQMFTVIWFLNHWVQNWKWVAEKISKVNFILWSPVMQLNNLWCQYFEGNSISEIFFNVNEKDLWWFELWISIPCHPTSYSRGPKSEQVQILDRSYLSHSQTIRLWDNDQNPNNFVRISALSENRDSKLGTLS